MCNNNTVNWPGPCSCGFSLSVTFCKWARFSKNTTWLISPRPARRTHLADKKTWRHVQDAMCGFLWYMIEGMGVDFSRLVVLNRKYLILLEAAKIAVGLMHLKRGITRPPPFNRPFIVTDVHPLTRQASTDASVGRRAERIAMNALRWEMMDFGESFVRDLGGDVQHQILHAALIYLANLEFGHMRLGPDGRVEE
jgi:hypothetical protein